MYLVRHSHRKIDAPFMKPINGLPQTIFSYMRLANMYHSFLITIIDFIYAEI